MFTKIEIKEEESVSDDLVTQNEGEFFVTMKRYNDVAIKTEMESETPLMNYLINPIKTETEIEEKTLVSDFGSQNKQESLSGDPVMQDKYNFYHEMEYKIEIKEEPLWHKANVCDDLKDVDFPLVASSRLCTEAVSGSVSGKSPLPPTEVSGRDPSFSNGEDLLQYEHRKSDVTEMPTAEKHVLSGLSGEYSEEGEVSTRSLYLKQKNVIHQGKRPHECKICDRRFTHLSNLKTHILIHEGKKPYKCHTCDKSYTRLSYLKMHTLIHEGRKPYQCTICGKSFTHLSNLNKHNLIHEGKKPHKCNTCEKSFTRLSHLKTHNLIHEGKKLHQCKLCGKSFTHLPSLKSHYLIHEGKKPHQCKTCNKRFTQLSNLKSHNLIHEGTKPHQCKTCDKTFTQLSHLKSHGLIHEGKKPHHCRLCDKSFTYFSSLKRHGLIHKDN